MKTTLLFTRSESAMVSTLAIVSVTSNLSQDPAVLMVNLKSAITSWIKSTDEGKDAWNESRGDFNIGDFASYCNNDSMKQCLVDEGLLSVNVTIIDSANEHIPFDTILADEDELDSKA